MFWQLSAPSRRNCLIRHLQSTSREWFFQLQRSFQLLEALGSSRIADSKNNEASVQWAQFVLQGLFNELQKTEKLTDINYVRDFILEPVLQDALRKA